MYDISFRDWRRTEKRDRDLTEGFLDNGKRCVNTFPWQLDPAIEEQGSWFQSSCDNNKAFVCQHAATTQNIVLNVSGYASFSGSAEFYGGDILLQTGELLGVKVTHAGKITIGPLSNELSSFGVLRTVLLEDGSLLRLNGPGDYYGQGDVFIGELTLSGLQPGLEIGPKVNLTFYPATASNQDAETSAYAVVSARVESNGGSVRVGPGVLLDFGQVQNVYFIGYQLS